METWPTEDVVYRPAMNVGEEVEEAGTIISWRGLRLGRRVN